MLDGSELPASTVVARVTGGRWAGGQSGNPRGRPPRSIDISVQLREHVPAAVAALVQALGNPRERIAAIQIILDRVYGKAIQPIASQDGAPNVLHLLAARLVSSDLLQELGARPTAASTEPQPAIIDLRAIPPALE